jgi:hypothetical protein
MHKWMVNNWLWILFLRKEKTTPPAGWERGNGIQDGGSGNMRPQSLILRLSFEEK